MAFRVVYQQVINNEVCEFCETYHNVHEAYARRGVLNSLPWVETVEIIIKDE